jgi:RimJ/RimL family protein N-acetyltransferase
MKTRLEAIWEHEGHRLRVVEPDLEQLQEAAASFSAWYSETHNRAMMTGEPMSPEDALEYHRESQAAGNRIFFLHADGQLMGDADFRHVERGSAEWAIMVGNRLVQGKGLGTSFGILLHHVAFSALGLQRVYLAVIPANVGGRRCYEKLGYAPDPSAEARRFAEDETDLCMSLPREQFYELHWRKLEHARIRLVRVIHKGL